MEKTVFERVKDILKDRYALLDEEVKPEANFNDDLGMDSLDKVELIMEMEKEFNYSIDDNDAEKITTVGEAVRHIEDHTSLRSAGM